MTPSGITVCLLVLGAVLTTVSAPAAIIACVVALVWELFLFYSSGL